MVNLTCKDPAMGQQTHFNSSAQLFENKSGGLAIRFANNLVFECEGLKPGSSFVFEAIELMRHGKRADNWRMIPYRKLLHDDQKWRLISSMGFLDGDENKPALLLEVKPEMLGRQARQYLKEVMPKTLH